MNAQRSYPLLVIYVLKHLSKHLCTPNSQGSTAGAALNNRKSRIYTKTYIQTLQTNPTHQDPRVWDLRCLFSCSRLCPPCGRGNSLPKVRLSPPSLSARPVTPQPSITNRLSVLCAARKIKKGAPEKTHGVGPTANNPLQRGAETHPGCEGRSAPRVSSCASVYPVKRWGARRQRRRRTNGR